ncbi:hypothetical protein BT69DRAFT_1230071, partial [Atractiella rhizophila]
LEQDMKKMQVDLESERSLAQEKHNSLAHAKQREAELVEEMTIMQQDLDTLENQLERAIIAQTNGQKQYQEMKDAFDQAAQRLLELEQARHEWAQQEIVLKNEAASKTSDWEKIANERDSLCQEIKEREIKLLSLQQDFERIQRRAELSIKEAEARLAAEIERSGKDRLRVDGLQNDLIATKEQLAQMTRSNSSYETSLKTKDAEFLSLQNRLSSLTKDHNLAVRQQKEWEARANELSQQVDGRTTELKHAEEAKFDLAKEVDGLRTLIDAKASEDEKQKQGMLI